MRHPISSALFLIILMAAGAGCGEDAPESGDVAAEKSDGTGAAEPGDLAGAEQVVSAFRQHVIDGDLEAAWSLTAQSDKFEQAFVDRERSMLEELCGGVPAGLTWRIVETKVIGSAGVSVFTIEDTSGVDPDPCYLVLLDGEWKVIPGMKKYDPALLVLGDEHRIAYEQLAGWYQMQHAKLVGDS